MSFMRVFRRNNLANHERVMRKNAATRKTFEAMIHAEIAGGTKLVEREGDKIAFSIRPTMNVVQDWFDLRRSHRKEIDGNSGARELFVAWLRKLKMPQLVLLFALFSATVACLMVEVGILSMENIPLAGGVLMIAMTSLFVAGMPRPKEAEFAEDYDWATSDMMQAAKRYVLFGDSAAYISAPSTKDQRRQTTHDRAAHLRVVPYSEIGRIEPVLRDSRDGYNAHDHVVYDKAGLELFRVDRRNMPIGVNAVYFLKERIASGIRSSTGDS